MKPITALLLLSLAGTGAACSDTVTSAPKDPAAETAAAAEVQGTMNLNIGRTDGAAGRQIVGSGAGATSGGLIVGPASTGGNFEGVEDLGIEIEDLPADVLEPQAPKPEEDVLVRIPERN